MRYLSINRVFGLMILLVVIFFTVPYPGVSKGAEIPSVEDVINGKALAPTIEDLTGGKVKIGDIIDDKNTVSCYTAIFGCHCHVVHRGRWFIDGII